MSRLRLAVLVSLAASASACTGEDGLSYLTDLADEPAGSNCSAGGVQVNTGPDSNGNGVLDAAEIETTKYVCGKATLTDVTPEPAGTNCSAGGVKIRTGIDTDDNGTLDAGEVKTTNYVCGSGEAVIAKGFAIPGVLAAATPTTILPVDITTTSPGTLLAIGTSDLFCTAAECPAGNPAVSGYLWIADGLDVVAPVAEYDYLFMEPGVTHSVTRTATFPITGAGAYSFHLRGQRVSAQGSFTFYRSGLTLVFLP